MRMLIVILFACIRFVSAFTNTFTNQTFVSIWNAPTEICGRKYSIPLNLSRFDIVANSNDTFIGNDIVIFYKERLGLYPWITRSGQYVNGGLPQLSNIEKHLQEVRWDITQYIPSENFTGLAVIDWEEWRPLFDRNSYNTKQKVYVQASIDLVRSEHPDWSEQRIVNEARFEFETSAKLDWLFAASSALLPSVYLRADFGSHRDRYNKVYGTLDETLRLKRKYAGVYTPIIPYTRFRYGDTDEFYDLIDLNSTVRQIAEAGMNGLALWDSSFSIRSASDCTILQAYIDAILGPFVRNVSREVESCSQTRCSSHGRCSDRNVSSSNTLSWYDVISTLLQTLRHLFFGYHTTGHRRWKHGTVEPFPTNNRCTCFQGWSGEACNHRTT